MNLLDKFNKMIHKPVKPQGVATKPDEESLSLTEKRQLAFMRKENMRRDLLEAGYGGWNRGPSGRS